MAELTRRQVLTAAGGGLAAVAVTGLVGNAVVRVLAPTLFGDLSRATAFGRVAVLGARREHHAAAGLTHGGARVALPDHLAPQHLPWSDHVRVDIQVENASRRPVLLSPGQFRLRIGGAGPTVSLYDAGHQVLALAAGTALTTWVAFLAPPGVSEFGVEYTEAGAATPHIFRVVTGVTA
jgi:hypothetical protein